MEGAGVPGLSYPGSYLAYDFDSKSFSALNALKHHPKHQNHPKHYQNASQAIEHHQKHLSAIASVLCADRCTLRLCRARPSTGCARFTTACSRSNVGHNAHRKSYESAAEVDTSAVMVPRGVRFAPRSFVPMRRTARRGSDLGLPGQDGLLLGSDRTHARPREGDGDSSARRVGVLL